ncbi:CoA transferase [Xanthobacter sp.]|uniref:CaiB/BaiF CoA transferase family protein n=1 Tax=Xanthobacter sp. TaxID=35809 RepID=UPI0025EA5D10|nr:CoA transferase [Xanthobacter sp.]
MSLLKGVRVISFNHFLAGPHAAQMLGDMGADVIAVEPLDGAFQRNWAVAGHFVAGESVNHLNTGRSKRSIALDMKSTAGRAIAERLVAGADVVMENFRPGTMAKFGMGPEDLRARYPRLIYASATGFGATGPFAHRPGQDLLLQAMSGLAAHTGPSEGPPVPLGSVVIDHHTAVLCVLGIVASLFAREQTGDGRRVDVSLLQSAIDLQGEPLTAWLNGAPHDDGPRAPQGVASWFSSAGHGIHRTADGCIAISMAAPAVLARALDLPELAEVSPETMLKERASYNRLIVAQVATRTTAEWQAALDAAGVWNAPVEDYDAVRENPQLAHLGAFQTATSSGGAQVTFVSHPVHYDSATLPIARVPQPLGAQTREILAEVGYAADEIETFLTDDVVRAASAA